MSLFNNPLDLTESKLLLEGSEEERKEIQDEIKGKIELLEPERLARRTIINKRHDFYIGKHHYYSNVTGKVSGPKDGHANAVFNYAGKSVVKIALSLANNPPMIDFPARKVEIEYRQQERIRAQGVEDFVKEVFRDNFFFKGPYRKAVFNQVLGDGFLKICPVNVGTKDEPDWSIRITSHEKMENLSVAWRSDDPSKFDHVIATMWMTKDSIYREFGIKVPDKRMGQEVESSKPHPDSSHYNNNQYGNNTTTSDNANIPPDSRNNINTIRVDEYDDKDKYVIMIDGEMVQHVVKDGETYPDIQFWTPVQNIPNPGYSWSVSDIDFVIDPQVEFNEASNEERNYIRVGANQKFVAYNMDEFDPNSLKTGSGQVIFVSSPDGSARFEPLNTNVNVFPIDAYLNRVQQSMYDLGIPKVTFGAGGADSGRSKTVDYQTLVDLTQHKRDSWELALNQVIEKIQILGHFYYPELDIFNDPSSDMFVIRYPDYDWAEVTPLTQSDKIVNVLNKVTMGLPFRLAFKELGYKDVEEVIESMKEEAQDADLMMFRAKMYEVSQGLVGAQARAQQQMQGMNETNPMASPPGAPSVNQASPVMDNQGSEGGTRPVSQSGGTTSFSSPAGVIGMNRQNQEAGGY